MSGPAKNIARNLRMVENVTKAINKTPLHMTSAMNKRSFGSTMFREMVAGAGAFFGPKGARGVLGTAGALVKADAALNKVGMSLGGVVMGGAAAATGAIAAIAGTAAYASVKLSSMAIDYGTAGAKFVLQTTAFREDTLLGLQAMLKSKEAASKIYNQAVKFAAVTPFDTKEVIGMGQSLIGMGFKPEELKRVMTAVGDMAAAKGMNKEIIGRLSLAMGQIRAKGRLQGDEAMQLMEAGLNQGQLYEEIGKMMGGKTTDAVRKLQEQGKINSNIAIEAILRTAEKGFGGTMDLKSGGMSGLLSTLQSRPFDLVDRATGDNSGIAVFSEKVKGVVKSLAETLDPDSAVGRRITLLMGKIGLAFAKIVPSGNDVATVVEKIVKGIEKLMPDIEKLATEFGGTLDKLLPKDEKGIEGFGRTIINVLRMVNAFVSGFVTGISTHLGLAFAAFGGDGQTDVESMRKGFENMGKVVGDLAGRLVTSLTTIAQMVEGVTKLVDKFNELTTFKVNIGGEQLNIGTTAGGGVVEGFVNMLTGGYYRAYEAAGMLGQAAQAGLAYVNQSHSPSKVFEQHGRWATEGYLQGMGIPDVDAAMRQTFAIPSGGLGGGAIGGSQMSIGNVNVSAPLHLSGADTETAKAAQDAVARLLPDAVAHAFEQIAAEMGVA